MSTRRSLIAKNDQIKKLEEEVGHLKLTRQESEREICNLKSRLEESQKEVSDLKQARENSESSKSVEDSGINLAKYEQMLKVGIPREAVKRNYEN